ncbi:MAG: trypsin-like peptidase domain-containing protein [Pirellulaceae bacterium]|nr:trypsin-like peptidase domain-containing protein [Pirellulaceae bacterium]
MFQPSIRLRTATSALATIIAGASFGSMGQPVLAETPVSARQTDTVRAILAAEPAVVNIEGNKPSGKGAGEAQQVNGMGSGVIIDSRGYILTNQHVVQDVTRIEVTLHDGSKYIGIPIDHDPSTDLALVKIEAPRPVPVIRFGTSSDLMRGEKVVAIGNPFGYQHTVTEGIISALHRDIPVNGVQEYEDLIQTDASINPGNSGGPLVNIDGDMIGLNAAVRVGAQGIGFAIPVDKALDVAALLIHRSHGLEVPFEVRTTSRDGHTELRVHRARGTATLTSGDTIKRVGNQTVHNRLQYELALLDHRPGSAIDIEYERDGQSRVERIEGMTRPATGVSLVSARNQDQSSVAWNLLGVRLRPADGQQVKAVDSSYNGGLVIDSIRPSSPAALAKLQRGDVLVGLLEWQTPNWKDLEWILSSDEMKQSRNPKFRIIRGSGVFYGNLDLTKPVGR